MLDNKFALFTALTLFLAAAGYNVWFFFLQGDGEGGSGDVVGPGADSPPARVEGERGRGGDGAADGARPDSALSGLEALVRAAREGSLPVRPAAEFDRVRAVNSAQPAWGRDPLSLREPEPQRPARPAPDPPDWSLGAVMTGGDRNVAVIDGTVYSEGDAIDGGTVVEVAPRRVVIRWRGRRIVLELDRGM